MRLTRTSQETVQSSEVMQSQLFRSFVCSTTLSTAIRVPYLITEFKNETSFSFPFAAEWKVPRSGETGGDKR